jgi:transketolase
MRRIFAKFLKESISKNKNIVLVTSDLGYGMFDEIRDEFPNNFINCGASEQLMMGMCVGLCYEGKIPVAYSITPFLLYRPFEIIRNYVNKENLNIKLVGSGRDRDYLHDGFSHWCEDDSRILDCFDNIYKSFPSNSDYILNEFEDIFRFKMPCYLNLQR